MDDQGLLARGRIWTATEAAVVVAAVVAVVEIFRTSEVGVFGTWSLLALVPLLSLGCAYAAFRAGALAGGAAVVACTAYGLWFPVLRGGTDAFSLPDAALFLAATGLTVGLVAALRRRALLERARTAAEAARGQRREDLLQRARQVLRTTADLHPDGLLALSPSGRVIIANRRLGDLTGIDPASLRDRAWSDAGFRVAAAFREPRLLQAVLTAGVPALRAAELDLAGTPGGRVLVRYLAPEQGGLDPATGSLFVLGTGGNGTGLGHRLTALAREVGPPGSAPLELLDLLARLAEGLHEAVPEPLDLAASLPGWLAGAGLTDVPVSVGPGRHDVEADPRLAARLVTLLVAAPGLDPPGGVPLVLVVDTGRAVRLSVRHDGVTAPPALVEALARDFRQDPLPLAGARWLELNLARGLASVLGTGLRAEQPSSGGVAFSVDLPYARS